MISIISFIFVFAALAACFIVEKKRFDDSFSNACTWVLNHWAAWIGLWLGFLGLWTISAVDTDHFTKIPWWYLHFWTWVPLGYAASLFIPRVNTIVWFRCVVTLKFLFRFWGPRNQGFYSWILLTLFCFVNMFMQGIPSLGPSWSEVWEWGSWRWGQLLAWDFTTPFVETHEIMVPYPKTWFWTILFFWGVFFTPVVLVLTHTDDVTRKILGMFQRRSKEASGQTEELVGGSTRGVHTGVEQSLADKILARMPLKVGGWMYFILHGIQDFVTNLLSRLFENRIFGRS